MNALVGIFVGGKGTRMGGVAKGLLSLPGSGQSLLARALGACASALPGAAVVLVGDALAYAAYGLPAVADDPPGVGPIGGLHALLRHASEREAREVVALSCDLPYFSAELLCKLMRHAPGAEAVAPRQAERWQPLFARYSTVPGLRATEAALGAGERALQRVLSRLTVSELVLSARELEELRDWDEPGDVGAP